MYIGVIIYAYEQGVEKVVIEFTFRFDYIYTTKYTRTYILINKT